MTTTDRELAMRLGLIGTMIGWLVAAVAVMATGTALAQSGDVVTLKWALWDWDKVAYYKPLIEAYQAKHPNVKFEAVDLGSQDYQQMTATQLAGGSKDIDIVTVKDVPNYANLVRAGTIEDLSGFMA